VRSLDGLSAQAAALTILVVVTRIRNAAATEASVLEALQRRSSDVWEEYREQLAGNPDAIELRNRSTDGSASG